MSSQSARVKNEESALENVPGAAAERALRQRLVVCLDGTWNERDSGTNVYHLSNLIQEGEVVAADNQRWMQRIYYDQGVGTGLLDGVTGGAFGIGLEANVREAYDWLVEKYCDGDEIYLFGFSRGAFTARSLVGLIAKCGLLYRGAPIPPEELWNGYQILGRHLHARTGGMPAKNWWERIVGRPPKPFREIWELKREAWEQNDPDNGKMPIAPPANRTERLLIEWSRRVPITCVGVFDTVGSIGLDALAIPWLRERTAQFHDTHLTTLIVNGFHALAMDEHRANFSHIPWHRIVGSPLPSDKTQQGGRIKQCWFVGAHSNIGGGYPDDVLAQFPLAWFIQQCMTLGLQFRNLSYGIPAPMAGVNLANCLPLQPPQVRDSFAEMGSGVWKNVIRSKRNYRRMVPPPELQNGRPVQSVNECLDPSVLQLCAANAGVPGGKTYNPPNLWECRLRAGIAPPPSPPPHRYIEDTWDALWLALWVVGIGLTGNAFGWLLGMPTWNWGMLAAPVVFFVDWHESKLNHCVALHPDGLQAERRMAWMDVYLFIRILAVIAFGPGIIIAIVQGWSWLLRGGPWSEALWLLALDAGMMWFGASAAWCAAAMNDAGLGSIVTLQKTRNPGAVTQVLSDWAAGSQCFLMPVVQTIWRDMLAFIPVYSVVLFVGSWLALSLITRHFFEHGTDHLMHGLLVRGWWVPAAIGTLLCALADYVEDCIHLSYIKHFPTAPPRRAVRVAVTATCTKFALFTIGILTVCGAAAWLCVKQVIGVVWGTTGGLSVILVVATVLIFSGQLRAFRSTR